MTVHLARLIVPLVLLGVAVPGHASAPRLGKSKPTVLDENARTFRPAAGAKIDLSHLHGNDRLRQVPVRRSPEVTALVAAALRRYADGVRSAGPLDDAIAKALNKSRNGRAAAKRIVARIDGLTPSARAKAFADNDPKAAVTAGSLSTAMASAGSAFSGLGVKPADTLPAQNIPLPSSLALSMTGLKATEISDADGKDELLALATFVRLDAQQAYVVEQVSAPASGMLTDFGPGDVDPLDRSIYTGASTPALLTTAVFEVDNDVVSIRDEYAAMVALAKPLAEQLATAADDATTRLGRFAFALDYTVGLLAISQSTTWPAGVLQKSMLTGSTSLGALWATPGATAESVKWKLAHVHDLPAGHYTVYFDVPSPPLSQPNVKVKIARVEALDGEGDGDDLTVTTRIGDQQLTKELTANKSVHNPNWTVQRKVNSGKIEIEIGAKDFDAGPAYGQVGGLGGYVECGDPPGPEVFQPCPDSWDVLDFVPAEAWSFSARLTLDVATGKITGHASGDVGDTLTLVGDGAPRGKLKVVITVDD